MEIAILCKLQRAQAAAFLQYSGYTLYNEVYCIL